MYCYNLWRKMTNFNIDKIGDNAHLLTNVILNNWNNLAISEISDEEIEAISKLQDFIGEKIVDLEKKCKKN